MEGDVGMSVGLVSVGGDEGDMVDLGAEMTRPRSSNHSETRSAWAERALEAEGTRGLEKESVKSSPYEVVSRGDCG